MWVANDRRDGGLEDKVAVVTGAAGGIGAASAARLAELGARVVLVDRDAERVEAVAASLGPDTAWVAGDVSVEADVNRYLQVAVEKFGSVDLHHLNAGIPGSLARLPEVSLEEFQRVMGVNVNGVFLGIRGAFRWFEWQQSTGAIVVTASIGSLRGSADLIAYQTSKHAVLGLVHGAAVYGGPLGVRVNAVAPGIVPTDLFAGDPDQPGGKNDMEQRASTTPLRRAGTPREIADVVAFLLGDGASYVTGSVLSADGGASTVSSVRPSGGAGAWDVASADEATYGRSLVP